MILKHSLEYAWMLWIVREIQLTHHKPVPCELRWDLKSRFGNYLLWKRLKKFHLYSTSDLMHTFTCTRSLNRWGEFRAAYWISDRPVILLCFLSQWQFLQHNLLCCVFLLLLLSYRCFCFCLFHLFSMKLLTIDKSSSTQSYNGGIMILLSMLLLFSQRFVQMRTYDAHSVAAVNWLRG